MLVEYKNNIYVLSSETTVTKSYYFEDEDYESHIEDFDEIERDGYLLMPKNYSNSKVVVDGNKLSIGGKSVEDYSDECSKISELEGKIPALYVIRTWNGDFMSFECGFDLHDDGRFWANGNYFDEIEECFVWLQNKFGDFSIFLEEPMRF